MTRTIQNRLPDLTRFQLLKMSSECVVCGRETDQSANGVPLCSASCVRDRWQEFYSPLSGRADTLAKPEENEQ